MEAFMLLIWTVSLWMPVCWCAPEVPWCPVAVENQPFELNCTLDMIFQETNTFIIWRLIEKLNISKDISTCGLSQQGCDSNKPSKHAVKFFDESGKKVFSLKFKNVSLDVGDSGIKCLLWTLNRDDIKELFSCQMAVYRPGRGVQCTLQPITGGVKLECTIKGVYPGIICRFNETLNNVMKKSNILMNTTNIGYNTSGSLVYKSTCQATVYHTQTGTYEYTISYKPNYPQRVQFNGRLQKDVMNIPTVKALQVHSTLDPGNTNITVMCLPSGFLSKPVFKLFLENHEILPREYRTNVAIYNINVNSSFQDKLIKCEVDFEDNPWKDFSIYDIKALKLKWPPPTPPFFVDNHSRANLGNVLQISRGGNVSLACVAPGGKPGVSYIRVQCWRNLTLWHDISSGTSIVSFKLFGDNTFEIQGCLCIAHQPITFYNATSFIIVYVNSSQGKNGPELWDSTANKMMPVYYIIAVTLFLLLLPIIIGTCISRHKADLSTYWYSARLFQRSRSTLESNEYISNICIAEEEL